MQVSTGALPPDHAILRRISALTRSLPSLSGQQLQRDLLTEYTDSQAVAYLATLTKGASGLAELIDKVGPLRVRRNLCRILRPALPSCHRLVQATGRAGEEEEEDTRSSRSDRAGLVNLRDYKSQAIESLGYMRCSR